jgi:hypothetical protein
MKQSWVAVSALTLILGGAAAGFGQAAPMAMEHHDDKPGVPSHTLTVVAGGKSTVLTMADLQAMPQITLKVHNGHSNEDETYTGVPMSALLAKFGLTLANGGAHKVYHSYVKAEGTDKYWVLYSATELEPEIATWDSLVAITVNGHPIVQNGDFRMIAGGERRPARWVENLSSLTIVTVE